MAISFGGSESDNITVQKVPSYSDYRGLGGDDTYNVDPGLTQNVIISDSSGVNTVVFGNARITKSAFFNGGLQLTFETGGVLTVLGNMSNYRFVFGGGENAFDPAQGGTVKTFNETVQSFNLNPDALTTDAVQGSSNVVINDNGSLTPFQTDPNTTINTTFTLKPVTITPSTPDSDDTSGTTYQPVLMWGYTPDRVGGGNGAGPEDGGIPASELIKFLVDITGLDFFELGLIDDDGVDPAQVIDQITNITLTDVNANKSDLTITMLDGTQISAEAFLGDKYLDFLKDLIFDADGNSRLYMYDPNSSSSNTDPNSSYTSTNPIILTTTQNNGGTVETGYTTVSNDMIVAGKLDLLHKAYIDAGGGNNVLEIDAKGIYAQPLRLANIQKISIQNLPNVYGDTNTDPLYPDGNVLDSILDLSRATELQELVITEGLGTGVELGSLNIVGIRNGAEVHLDGSFTEDVNLHYGEEVSSDGVNLVLSNLNMKGQYEDPANLNIAHNSDTLNIESTGGGNWPHNGNLGGRLSTLNITGDAVLYIEKDLDKSFHDDTPITINASANTAGVNLTLLNSKNITFNGSTGSDTLLVGTLDSYYDIFQNPSGFNDHAVNIIDTAGDNKYEVYTYQADITDGNGNSNYDVHAVSTNITTGNGNGLFEIRSISTNLTAGDGNNHIEISPYPAISTTDPAVSVDYENSAVINLGNGQNRVDVCVQTDPADTVVITAGDGGNTINARGNQVKITTGEGADTINVYSSELIEISSGGGDDIIKVSGANSDYVSDGAILKIDTGAGSSTITLGNTDYDTNYDNSFPAGDQNTRVTAMEGSFITGENITLFVNTLADLQAAELSGVTKVVLDNDNDQSGTNAMLTLTAEQFAAIGAANFSVEGSVFNTHAYIKIVVDETTSLTDLGIASLSRNIDLYLDIQDGATLTMTAQQLHERVAPNGVTLIDDNNTDSINGKVIITGGGQNFDPFNTSDTIKTNINGTLYVGGSLSDDFKVEDSWYNVTVSSLVNGYNRPADVPAEVVITIDSSTGAAPFTQDGFSTWHTNLEIVGDQDVTFTGAVNLGQELNGTAVVSKPFIVDFSGLEGQVINMTLDSFENVKAVYGNSNNGYDAEVLIQIAADSSVGPLVSQGVDTYVVSVIEGPTAAGSPGSTATIELCDTTQDLEVFALRGNYNDTLILKNAAWGLVFELQGGGTAKSEGPTETSNVGNFIANYQWPGAEAVVNLTHSVEGDARPVYSAGITIDNAESIAINSDGSAVIASLSSDTASALDLNADGSLTINHFLPDSVIAIDAAGVTGEFTASVAPTHDFTFTGAAGGNNLTIDSEDFDATDATAIDGADAGVDLTINGKVDLSAATLTNISSVILADDATFAITVEQMNIVGAENFSLAPGADNATLDLFGLNEEPFALSDFADGIEVGVFTVVAQPIVTLHPDTDLTGIASLAVPEGTVLNLTAAQFQQLDGDGTIVGIDGSTNFTVNITDLLQADVEDGLVLTNVAADIQTLTMAEDVVLVDTDDLGGFEVIMGDGMTLTLAEIQQADGLVIGGGTNTTLKFTDTYAADLESIDASGFDVDTLQILNVLVSGHNVDLMFSGLSESVTKFIYNDLGWVEGLYQYVVIEEGTTIPGFLVFNKPEAASEIRFFDLTMEGGTVIEGDLNLSASSSEAGLLQYDLDKVTIHSNGTAENLLTGLTANIIDGNITSNGLGDQGGLYTSVDNDLLDIEINAEQELTVTGKVFFESEKTADAAATLTVNGTADVNLGGVVTIDDVDDIEANDIATLNVINNSTGTLRLVLAAADIDAEDTLNFTGTGDVELSIDGNIDLSDDALDAVTQMTILGNSELTITQDQLDALTTANLLPDEDDATIGQLHIVGFGGNPFDATTIDEGINVASITFAGDTTLDPATNLTGVDQLIVPEGAVITMTAAQFQQLEGAGNIIGLDVDGDGVVGEYTVNIIDLMQSDILNDLNADGDSDDAGESFDLTGINGALISLALGEPVVNLADDTQLGDLTKLEVILADGQTLGLASSTQANGLVVNPGEGVPNTGTLVFMFAGLSAGELNIDAAGYNIDVLKALATFVGGEDVEDLLRNVPNNVEERYYVDPEELGFVSDTHRVVVVEEDVTVPGFLMYNDPQDDREVRTLNFTLEGGSKVDGDINLSTIEKTVDLVTRYFDTLTINSIGDEANEITGSIIATGVDVSPNVVELENNLLNVNINADQDLVIGGDIVFTSVEEEKTTANLTITGSADVTVHALDVTDDNNVPAAGPDIPDIVTLNITNNGTGTFTATGGTPAINGGIESLVLAGTGNMVFGSNPDSVLEYGVEAGNLSSIDASALSGDLALGEIRNVDNTDFTFTAGEGVTTLFFTTDELNVGPGLLAGDDADGDGIDDIDEAGWKFDFSNADADSVFTLGNVVWTKGPLEIDLGADTTLVITEDTDWTGIDLTIAQTKDIILTAGVELKLTAAEASGLNIISDPTIILDPLDPAYVPADVPVVNITELGTAEYDFSGIQTEIAGTATLAEDDITLADATDLGDFTVQLTVNSLDDFTLTGQTIRFTTVEQADNAVSVVGDGAAITDAQLAADGGANSTNVVWLFESISAPVNTSGYDAELGRLWLSEELITNEGGDIENLFTTAPSTILRVDFTDLDALNFLIPSEGINRTTEFVAFTDLSATGLIFSDADRLEHVENVTLQLGGEVDLGDIEIDNIVNPAAGVDPASIAFNTLTINSHRALSDDHYLAPELYVNDNDGIDEPGEHDQPDNLNTVGDISVGAVDGLDLLNVNLNTILPSVVGDSSQGAGAVLNVGTITYDAGVAASNATLTVTGANNINIESVNTIDADIAALTVNTAGFTGTLTAPGASPAFQIDNTESLIFGAGGAGSTITLGSAANAGVAGNELSWINAANYQGTLRFGVVSMIDGTNDGAANAFLFTAGTGVNTMTLGLANGTAPSLAAGSDWVFNFTGSNTASRLTITQDVIFGAGDLTLTMDQAELVISGNVDFTALATLNVAGGGDVVLNDGAALEMSDEMWLNSGFAGKNFVDAAGAPAVLHVTAALAASLGGDLTLVRGYAGYDIDAGVNVTLREDQADTAYVAGDDANPGVLTGANVTIFVQETGFGDQDITNLVGAIGLIIEQDATDNTDNDLATLPNTFGYEVDVTAQQASEMVGNITKNGNIVRAFTGTDAVPDTADPVDLTDPAGDGSVAAYDLSEVDILDMEDDVIINLAQYNAIGDFNKNGNQLSLMAQGDLTAVDFTDVDNLIISGDTTITALQEEALGVIRQDDPAAAYTMTIDALEELQETIDAGDGLDGIAGNDDDIIQTGNITVDLSNIVADRLVVNFDTTIPADYENLDWNIIDTLVPPVASDFANAELVLSGGETVNIDIEDAMGRTITGAATVDLLDAGNLLNGTEIDLSNIEAAVAGLLTINADAVLDLNTDIGSFDMNIAATFTLTLTGAQAAGLQIAGDGDIVLNNVAAGDDLSGILVTGTKTINALGDIFSIDASQADGAFIADAVDDGADIDLLTVNVNAFEAALDSDLSNLDNTQYTINVALDSTGDVVLAAEANLSSVNDANDVNGEAGDSQVTISGNGRVTLLQDADVSTTDFIVGEDAVLVANQSLTGVSLINEALNANVSGDGTLEYVGLANSIVTLEQDVRFSTLVFGAADINATINGFDDDTFQYAVDGLNITLGAHQLDFTALFGGAQTFALNNGALAGDGTVDSLSNITLFNIAVAAANTAAGVANSFTDTTVAGATGELDGVAADTNNVQIDNAINIFLISDNADTYIWKWTDGQLGGGGVVINNNEVDDGELTLMGVLTGVNQVDLAAFTANNFA